MITAINSAQNANYQAKLQDSQKQSFTSLQRVDELQQSKTLKYAPSFKESWGINTFLFGTIGTIIAGAIFTKADAESTFGIGILGVIGSAVLGILVGGIEHIIDRCREYRDIEGRNR